MRVFIGSSTEARRLVEWLTARIGKLYASRLEPVPWTIYWQGGKYPLEQLKKFVDDTDGALLFMTADDRTWYRQTERHEPRDNLVFEAGLFFAEHGRDRTQLLIPDYTADDPLKRKVALPSDLGGLTVNYFPWPSGNDVDIDATGLPNTAAEVCNRLVKLGPRPRFPRKLEFLVGDYAVEPVSTFVGSFRDVLNNGIIRLVQEQSAQEIDIVVAYRIGEFRRVLTEFRKRPESRLRVCFANLWDDALLEIYRRKYFDRDAAYMRNALQESIRGLLGPCDIEYSEQNGVQITNLQDAPAASYQIAFTDQRITYSFYRVDDIAFVVPLDMKRTQDPAPLAWSFAKDTAPRTYRQYVQEYEQFFSEAKRVYPA